MLKSNQSHHLYGFTDLKTLNDRGPLVISHGKGIYVYDIYDKKYLSKAYIKHVEKFLESIGKSNSRYRYNKNNSNVY